MNLQNPDKRYRPVPFWSWNDRLEPEELRRQIREMNAVGIGGYFMHARGGLQTEYLSEEWMTAVAAAVDEGRKTGMHAWAYDENGWPSGFAGGIVSGMGVDYQQKYLRMEAVSETAADPEERTIALYRESDGSRVEHSQADAPLLRLYYDVNPYYVDTLDAEVIRAFLSSTYETYRERLSADAFSALAGFFTDEPQVSRNGIPWSFTLPDAYRERWGEELTPVLPHLFRPFAGYRRTRYRFWRLVTELFMTGYMKQIHDWCEEHGVRITGHHVLEETYLAQLTSNGAIMPHYQYYHIPGMDWLGRHIKPSTTPVQVASVCAQLGKKQILSETFALCGWAVRFEELKWIYEWQMVHGINLLCQHLEGYSLRGIRKRDYPASLFYHQPWWKDYRFFNDYASRIGMLLAEGEIRTDVLVLHGQSSAWLCYDDGENEGITECFESLNGVSELLDQAHVPYHYGDETILEQHGSVTDGALAVGMQRYTTVVVPRIETLARSTAALLREFSRAGGTILAVRNRRTEGRVSLEGEDDAPLSEHVGSPALFDTEEALAAAVGEATLVYPVVPPGTAPADASRFQTQVGGITCAVRHFQDLGGAPGTLVYYVNSHRDADYETDLLLEAAHVERFDAETGQLCSIAYTRDGDWVRVPHVFPRMGSLLVVARPTPPEQSPAARADTGTEAGATTGPRTVVDLEGVWELERLHDNALTLDTCTFYFDGVRQAENESVMVVQDRLLRERRPVDLKVVFPFHVAEDAPMPSRLDLVVETPEVFHITVNGREVPSESSDYFWDRAFRRLPIAHVVRPGGNEIVLETRFQQSPEVYEKIERAKKFESEKNNLSYGIEIEAVYLAGDFGVRAGAGPQSLPRDAVRYPGPFAITAPEATAPNTDVLSSGLPFYPGAVRLERDFTLDSIPDDAALAFDRLFANSARVWLNGTEVKHFFWRPYHAPVGSLLRRGENRVTVELTGSLRNLLGPHHLEEGESYAVGPFSFYKEPGVFSRRWDGGRDFWNDGYCFVRFGIEGIRIEA